MIERRRPDGGFTLVEVLIVTVLIGLVALAISAVFTVIVRTSPPTEARADDARSLLGATTWIPSDASSTPQVPEATAARHWDRTNVASGCTGSDPGQNVLRMAWQEQLTGAPTDFVASYRLVDQGDTSVLLRVSCTDGGVADDQTISADLPPVSETPVVVNWKTETRSAVSYIVGVEVTITTIDGDVLRVDGASVNVNQSFETNNAPTATTTAVSVEENSTVSFTLNATDIDGDTLTASVSGAPVGWVVTPTSGTAVTVSLSVGTGTGVYSLGYVVSDGDDSASSTIEVTVTAPAANSAPTAADTYVSVEEGTQTTVALNTNDADGDVLTPNLSGAPVGWVVNPNPGTTPTVDIDPIGATPASYSFTYDVSDGTDTSATATVFVTVTPAGGPTNTPPTAGPSTATVVDGGIVSFTLNASDADPADVLTANITGAPPGWTVTATPGPTVSVQIDTSTVGPGTYVLDYTVTDGTATTPASTITVTVTPVPCSASFVGLSPNPVEHDDSSNGSKKIAPLLQDVTVSITASGDCSDLRLRYYLTSDATSERIHNFGDPDWLELPGNVATERWLRGDHVLELVEIPISGSEIPHGTATLTVVRDT